MVVGALGTVKKSMVDNIKKVKESYCDRDPKDLRSGIYANARESA